MRVASLFCGCGGLDFGFKKAGFELVWSNDFDKYAVESYNANFKHNAICADINEIDLNDIPEHDILIGGFPCQPFSMMGQKKGFEDNRGTLFFRVIDIIENQGGRGSKPKVVVLENVRNLLKHNNGETYNTIRNELEAQGYRVFSSVINSADYGVPQVRNRVYIIGFLDNNIDYVFPKTKKLSKTLQDLLEDNVEDKYFLSERIKKTILSEGSKNYKAKPEIDRKVAKPLTATMAKMHRASQDNYVTQKGRLRRLTPRECARLQGFPDSYNIVVSDAQAYKQFGNAVTVNVSYEIAKSIKKQMGGELNA